MDYKSIQELIKTVSDSKLTALEIETEGIRIKMSKGEILPFQPSNMPVKASEVLENASQVLKEVSFEEAVIGKKSEVTEQPAISENTLTIKSPIVGTFYASPSPEEEAFVKVGSEVKKGDTICIIEAMKLMNAIEAEEDCEILEILVGNEQIVEYGQPLFKIAKI